MAPNNNQHHALLARILREIQDGVEKWGKENGIEATTVPCLCARSPFYESGAAFYIHPAFSHNRDGSTVKELPFGTI